MPAWSRRGIRRRVSLLPAKSFGAGTTRAARRVCVGTRPQPPAPPPPRPRRPRRWGRRDATATAAASAGTRRLLASSAELWLPLRMCQEARLGVASLASHPPLGAPAEVPPPPASRSTSARVEAWRRAPEGATPAAVCWPRLLPSGLPRPGDRGATVARPRRRCLGARRVEPPAVVGRDARGAPTAGAVAPPGHPQTSPPSLVCRAYAPLRRTGGTGRVWLGAVCVCASGACYLAGLLPRARIPSPASHTPPAAVASRSAPASAHARGGSRHRSHRADGKPNGDRASPPGTPHPSSPPPRPR